VSSRSEHGEPEKARIPGALTARAVIVALREEEREERDVVRQAHIPDVTCEVRRESLLIRVLL